MSIELEQKFDQIGQLLKEKAETFEPVNRVYEYGLVKSADGGVVYIGGLPGRVYGELLDFGDNTFGMTMELRNDEIAAVLLSGGDSVGVSSRVRGTGKVVEVPVGEEILGRVLNPLGHPLDAHPIHPMKFRPIEQEAPKIMERQAVNQPMETGLLAIDSMISIGRGQRELIIGDRQTGKTQIAIDSILNQRGNGTICVYCAIGQKASTVANLIDTLREEGVMDYCVVVAAMASDSAAMQYIAPYAACAMAEGFMYEGKEVLIVYDDLSKHAVAYRELSLLLHRPPGREAYPGDVFYLHSRLLERSAHLNDELGGGSMTALPIVETMAGDISAYIPTNVISITDGQIFLESDLFHSGVRPAVNVGLSVSRVGRSAQQKAMQQVSGTLRIDLAQYRELAIFSQFGSDIDPSTKILLDRGERLTEMLKQNKQQPLSVAQQVALLLAYREDALKNIEVKDVQGFCAKLLEKVEEQCGLAMQRINQTGDMNAEDKQQIIDCIHRVMDAELPQDDGQRPKTVVESETPTIEESGSDEKR